MSKNDILNDEREISRIAEGPAGYDEVAGVGRHGVTKITAYGEPGEYCLIPFYAVYKDDEIIMRVPAAKLAVFYAQSPHLTQTQRQDDMEDLWEKKKKGVCGTIYRHPKLEHAIWTNNGYGRNPGIFYDGKRFKSVDAAKTYAERVLSDD